MTVKQLVNALKFLPEDFIIEVVIDNEPYGIRKIQRDDNYGMTAYIILDIDD